MLFYLTIFIVCLVVAIVVLWFYRMSTDTSKAIFTTIVPSRVDESPSEHLNDTVAHKTRTDAESPLGTISQQTPRNLERTHRAKSIDQTPWGWPGHKRPPVRELRTQYASHNSVNEGPSADSESTRSQKAGSPYRDGRLETKGKVYNVTRKTPPPAKTTPDTLSKPWGW